MPWWGSIAATALLLRLATFPLFLKASDTNARSSALLSVTKPISARMMEAQKAGNTEGMYLAYQQLSAVKKRAGISALAQFTPVVVQGVIGFCGFRLLRTMADLPVPGFRDGGFLWLSDLTVSDPYGIIPVLMGGAIHLLMRWGGESGSANPDVMPPGMKNVMLYGMPGVIIIIMGWQPGALAVWFATTGAFSMCQALLLQQPGARKWFGIAPLYKPSKEEAQGSNTFKALLDTYTKPDSKKVDPAKQREKERLATMTAGTITSEGKNAAFMRPQWQAPNLHTNASSSPTGAGRVIDVMATTKKTATPSRSPATESSSADDMIPPPKPLGFSSKLPGMDYVKDTVSDYIERGKERKRGKEEARRQAARKQAADVYEKRAKERGK